MKTDRLIGILSVLLQRGSVTAPYLAQRFEVSRRTINRDVEDLCRAGIPVVTRQGAGGGISLAEGYALDHAMLSTQELLEIMTGDRSVLIDLSSWYGSSLAPKMQTIREGISGCRAVRFATTRPTGSPTGW